MKKDDICFLRAKQRGDDYVFDGIKQMGYRILIPYKDYNLFLRCLREIWFRLKMPGKCLWFNNKIRKVKAKIFIVKDPLIIPEFLVWLKNLNPSSRVILDYDNRVAMSVDPNLVDDVIAEKWSYDADDCKQYHMRLKHGAYLDIYKINGLRSPEYDILYVGRDKGRAKQLFELEKQFNELGLTTKFYICADRSFLRYKRKFYKPLLPYKRYLELLKRSRAILNIVQPGQTSITMREYECVFDSVKCITNNQAIKQFELYHPSRYFVLGQDSIDKLPKFLKTEFLTVSQQQLNKYTFDVAIKSLCRSTEK